MLELLIRLKNSLSSFPEEKAKEFLETGSEIYLSSETFVKEGVKE